MEKFRNSDGRSRAARTRSPPPSTPATRSQLWTPSERMNAICVPSGDQPIGLEMSSTTVVRVPPRNGTRWSVVPSPAALRTKSTYPPSGVTVGKPTVTSGSGGTSSVLLPVVTWRTRRLVAVPSVCTYATNCPSGEIAGAPALPLAVSCSIPKAAAAVGASGEGPEGPSGQAT